MRLLFWNFELIFCFGVNILNVLIANKYPKEVGEETFLHINSKMLIAIKINSIFELCEILSQKP